MKKTLIIIFLALSIVSQGQTFSSLLKDRTGWFNIVDYGATTGDTENDADNIRSAVTAAAAVGGTQGGGTVYIPAGEWYITDSVPLVAHVNILIEKNAVFTFPDNYFGSMWYVGGSNIFDTYVRGGYYRTDGNTNTWIGINVQSADGGTDYSMFNHFTDMWFNYPRYGINMVVTNDGWINGNAFKDIVMWRPVSGIRMRQSEESLGLNHNKFSNIEIQTSAVTEFGLDSLSGERNMFYGLSIYDVSGSTMDGFLTSDFDNNLFLGCFFLNALGDELIDEGGGNAFILAGDLKMPLGSKNISTITAEVGITREMLYPFMVYTGSSAVDITANPQIEASSDGEMITIKGNSNTNTLTLDDTDGLRLAGQMVLGQHDSITLIYSAYSGIWFEVSRSNN